MRLIDVDALKAHIIEFACDPCKKYGADRDGIRCPFCNTGNLLGEINEAPTADVVEVTLETAIDYLHKVGWMQEHDRILTESAKVKHGKWVENMEVGGVFCSECGRETFDRHDEPITMGTAKGFALVLPYYCGFCGAKMDKEGSADA